MPFYILAAALFVAWVAALLIGGGTLVIAGGTGLRVAARRSRSGRGVPSGLRPGCIIGLVIGALMMLIGVGTALCEVAVFASTAR